MHGRRLARTLLDTVSGAGPALTAALKKAKVPVQVESRDYLSLSDSLPRGWDRDATVRTAAGLVAKTLTGAALSRTTVAEVAGAMRIPGGGLVAPARLMAGATTRLAASRASVFERTRVTKISFTRTDAAVHTGARSIQATRVVICTDAPGELAPTLDRHVRAFERFHVLTAPLSASMRKAVGLANVIACQAPAGLAVTLTRDGRLLLSGGDSALLTERQRAAAHVQRTGQLMYECLKRFPAIAGLMPEFGWSSPIVAAPDRFPARRAASSVSAPALLLWHRR